MDHSITVKGLVVRHGGILFIKSSKDNNPLTIKTEFILVESGGLLQAGATAISTRYNPKSKLRIILTNPPTGYGKMGVVASQYSYKVYAPGVNIETKDKPEFTTYTGSAGAFGNGFGAKSIGIGFNGNLHLNGAIPEMIPYTGTWNAMDSNKKVFFDKFLSTNSTYAKKEYSNT